MGRHRNDPRGVGQVMAIVVAVVLLVGMIGLGVFFFYRSLPSVGATGTIADAPVVASAHGAEHGERS